MKVSQSRTAIPALSAASLSAMAMMRNSNARCLL